MLFLYLLKLTTVSAGVSDELTKLGSITESLYADEEAETCWAGLEYRALRKRGQARSAHQRLDKCSGGS